MWWLLASAPLAFCRLEWLGFSANHLTSFDPSASSRLGNEDDRSEVEVAELACVGADLGNESLGCGRRWEERVWEEARHSSHLSHVREFR